MIQNIRQLFAFTNLKFFVTVLFLLKISTSVIASKDNFSGKWAGKNVEITLNADSTFDLRYFAYEFSYTTCGHYYAKDKLLILTDLQDSANAYEVNCSNYSRVLKNDKIARRKNIWTVFDSNNQIIFEIKRNKLLWKEKHNVLTKQ